MGALIIAEPLLVGLCAALATLSGGALALRFRSRLKSLVGLSAGAVVGVALLDLLPEAIELGEHDHALPTLTSVTVCGFVAYLLLDRLFSGGKHIGPASLTAHSVMDGLAIGLAFRVSAASGLVLAFGVLAHDLFDGANTVTLALTGGGGRSTTRRWLAADALAPLAGIAIAQVFAFRPSSLALFLAFFAGGFLYIGASKLLPRSRDAADGLANAALVGLGLCLIYWVVRVTAN